MIASVFFLASFIKEQLTPKCLRCPICAAGSPLMSGLCEKCERQENSFKTESCKRCKFNTTQLFLETKTVRKFSLNCLDFTEKSNTLIQTEIFSCPKCYLSMKVSSDELYFICPQCSWVKEKNLS